MKWIIGSVWVERWDARCHISQADLLNNARTVLHRTSKSGRITRGGGMYF